MNGVIHIVEMPSRGSEVWAKSEVSDHVHRDPAIPRDRLRGERYHGFRVMKKADVGPRIERFIEQTAREVLILASVGLWLALTVTMAGCSQNGTSLDGAAGSTPPSQGGSADSGPATVDAVARGGGVFGDGGAAGTGGASSGTGGQFGTGAGDGAAGADASGGVMEAGADVPVGIPDVGADVPVEIPDVGADAPGGTGGQIEADGTGGQIEAGETGGLGESDAPDGTSDAESACGVSFVQSMTDILEATLRDVAWHVDPRTGVAYDHIDWKNGGNDYLDVPGVIPQLATDFAALQTNGRLDYEIVHDAEFSLDTAIQLTYRPSVGAGGACGTGQGGEAQGYVAFPISRNLATPKVISIWILGSSNQPTAKVRLKFETASCQIECLVSLPSMQSSQEIPLANCTNGRSCSLSETNKFTILATDDDVNGCPATWTIDHIAFGVDADESGSMSNVEPAPRCTGAFQPLPCGSSATGIDKIGYAMAALAVGACAGIDTEIVGFASVEDSLVAALSTVEKWRKWNGEAPGHELTQTTGFPWTWVDPNTGLPTKPEVFGIDSANFEASLAVLQQISATTCPALVRSQSPTWMLMANRAAEIRNGIDWARMNSATSTPVIGWCANPGASDSLSFCHTGQIDPDTGLSRLTQSARDDESILRTFRAIGSGSVDPNYWQTGLQCHKRTLNGFSWLSSMDAGMPVQCDATFRQQASALFMDLGRLPVPALAGISHQESLVALLEANGVGEYALAGYSDCLLPSAEAYVTGCEIPSGVVTPQASILGLEFFPDACHTIQRFLDEHMADPVNVGGLPIGRGFRDSAFKTTDGALDTSRPPGQQTFLSLDKSREALALVNYLHGGLVRRLFERNPEVPAAYEALRGKTGCAP